MATNQLDWRQLLPDLKSYEVQFKQAENSRSLSSMELQARLHAALNLFTQPKSDERFMLLKAQDSYEYLALIAEFINQTKPASEETAIKGARYHISENQISYHPAGALTDNFAASDYCLFEQWLEPEQLFGCLRQNGNKYTLEPGLIHKANGGILVLPLRTLLSQPLLWLKLKQTALSKRFDWVSPDETRPLALSVPSMPLDIKVVLVGDRIDLGDFQEIEPELTAGSAYGEFEAELFLEKPDDAANWCAYVSHLCQCNNVPLLNQDAFAALFKTSVRYTGDQLTLPLCPVWLKKQLVAASYYASGANITAENLEQAQADKLWREGYLPERARSEIEQGQIRIETQGEVIGQINGLSVLEYPGHPIAIGEPSRISCVAHLGDGEVTDVERKAELGGNLHAKGMMIMQAFIASELAKEQQLPFSASIVFEQSYGEVDGDSASLAELCALLSALSLQPINQQIAVTGSVDQFGNVQPIGGINEKIEAFFNICRHQGLTGAQGVIIPASNVRHLCLKDEVVDAVRNGRFFIFAVEHVSEAISLLTGLPYADEEAPSIISMIQERVEQCGHSHRIRYPWPFRWLN